VSLIIRPAQKDDAAIAACLLAETNGDFGIQVIGLGNPDLELKALQYWFADRKNRFSYEHTLIAEKYGIACGLLLAFRGTDLPALELGCSKKLFSIYSLSEAFRMVWANKFLVNAKEAERDEYLIAHLAVDSTFRRQGIAKALINRAAEDALACHLHKLVLEVEVVNANAVALYRKAGFSVTKTLYYRTNGSFKSPAYYKMAKEL